MTLKYRIIVGAVIGTPLMFLASIPWLKGQPDNVVFAVTGAAAFVVIAGSILLSANHMANLGEWERAGAYTSYKWGGAIGGGVVSLSLCLPFVQDRIVGIVAALSGTVLERTEAVLAFAGGVISVLLAQAIAALIALVIWRYRISRPI